MKKRLDNIRKSNKDIKLFNKITNSLLILVLGVILGIFSKWLDNLSINDEIWWQHILGIFDLSNIFSELGIWIFLAVSISVFSKNSLRASINVFLFFIGMTVSYHLYTIFFSGFNPKSYMLIWYGITLLSPILAYICWYAKSESKIAMVISSGIIATMTLLSFGIGMWYFDFKSIIDTIIFIGIIIVLYSNPKSSVISLISGIVLAFIVSFVWIRY